MFVSMNAEGKSKEPTEADAFSRMPTEANYVYFESVHECSLMRTEVTLLLEALEMGWNGFIFVFFFKD